MKPPHIGQLAALGAYVISPKVRHEEFVLARYSANARTEQEHRMSLNSLGEKLELRSEVEIEAAPDLVWKTLVDFGSFSRWNPYIVKADGLLAQGACVDMVVSPPGSREMRVRRHIEVLRPAEELRWKGRYGLGILLRGEQYFLLRGPSDGSATRLTVGENIYGPGVTGNNSTVLNISLGLSLMNQALKRRLESYAASRSE
jgi:hypothetical protein